MATRSAHQERGCAAMKASMSFVNASSDMIFDPRSCNRYQGGSLAAEIPAEPSPELRIPPAAQTRVISMSGIRETDRLKQSGSSIEPPTHRR
jgi:hypothetical protein